MVRKISFALLALAILITGVIAFRKLNYWESSVWIFKLNPPQQYEEGIGRDRGQRQQRIRINDRSRKISRDERRTEKIKGIGRQQGNGERITQDSNFRTSDTDRRKDFRGEQKINLGNVLWYLAAFASFTVAAIYIDKCLRLIRKNKKTDQCQ